MGKRTGLTFDAFEATFPDEYDAWLAGDESPDGAGGRDDLRRPGPHRARHARRASTRSAPGETGVVVTHGAALRVGVAGLLGWPDEPGRDAGRDGQLPLAPAARARRFGHLQLASFNEGARE